MVHNTEVSFGDQQLLPSQRVGVAVLHVELDGSKPRAFLDPVHLGSGDTDDSFVVIESVREVFGGAFTELVA